MDIVLWILVAVLVVIGFAGLIAPAIPGSLFIFAGLWLGAWINNYELVSTKIVWIMAFITVLTFVADFIGAWLGAKRIKASRQALIGAFIGTFAVFLFGPPGLILGPFIGAAIGEFVVNEDWKRATEVGTAATVGALFAVVAKIGLCFFMVGWFAVALLI